ncbi:hypothetical protein [Catenulispora pinisilvae]|uniref:hypothetical protein n=1 Tax=Catenulispora pinisilvae TaxID=2705253 RepID=UPI0018917D65|nr:hypothetical protein [Catenulispora pinisilvae]
MSSSARTSPARRPGPDGYGRQDRGSSMPPRSGRSEPPNAGYGRGPGPSGHDASYPERGVPGTERGDRGVPGADRAEYGDRGEYADRADRADRGASGADRRRAASRSGSGTASAAGDRLLAGAPNWLPAAAVLGGPILAVIVGKLLGNYYGPGFAVPTVLCAALAVAAATPNGRWWVMSALPPVAWLVAAVAELAWHDPGYVNTKQKLVGLVHATTHVFPVILVALVVMGLVIAGAVMRGRQSGSGRQSSTGRQSRGRQDSGRRNGGRQSGGRQSGGGARRV